MSFSKILVALDYHSPLAVEVFTRALDLANQHRSHLMLAHCLGLKVLEDMGPMIDTAFGLKSPTRLQQSYLQEMEQARQWLEMQCQVATNQGVWTDFICEVGDTGSWICDLARRWEAELIVIGHGGKQGLKERLFGSITNYVVQHTPCSVMIVPMESEPSFELRHLNDTIR